MRHATVGHFCLPSKVGLSHVQLSLNHNSTVGALDVPHVTGVDLEVIVLLLGSCV
jgi:hypothetical protein